MRFANLDWKPCPFCGNDNLQIDDENSFLLHDSNLHMCCEKCGTDVWVFDTQKYTYDEAVALMNTKWNTRKGVE